MGKIFQALEKSGQSFQNKYLKSEEADCPTHPDTKNSDQELKDERGADNELHTVSADTADPSLENLNANLIMFSKPYSAAAEQFRLLKTNILFPAKGDPPEPL